MAPPSRSKAASFERFALASATGATPPLWAMPLVGLGAWGPTLAAWAIASRRRQLRGVVGRWRTDPFWILLGLVMPLAVHLPATALDVALGGRPTHWLYPPARPEHLAALLMFPFGEELGWRGFAYPRLEARLGPVAGSLLLGGVWGLWHLGMLFAPGPGRALPAVFVMMAELALWSVVMAWIFERSDRSLAVAIAVHAGAHLDNVDPPALHPQPAPPGSTPWRAGSRSLNVARFGAARFTSVQALRAELRRFIAAHNTHSAKPFIWTKSTLSILDSVRRAKGSA